MLCKKCDTAINEKDAVCPYCGAKTPRRKRLKSFLSCSFACLTVLLCGAYIYFSGAETTAAPTTDISPSATANTGNGTQSGETSFQGATNPTEAPEPDPQALLWAELTDISDALSQYRYINDVSTVFITKDGYLYNYDEKRFVSAADLVADGLLDAKYENSKAMLLFLRPSDFKALKEADFGISPDLRVFAGLETADGVALCDGTNTGVIYRENFIAILSHYQKSGGAIETLTSSDPAFSDILSAIALYEGAKADSDVTGVFIRSVKSDGAYSVAFASIGDEPAVHKYLIYMGDASVLLGRFEEIPNIYERVNSMSSVFDLDLLPAETLEGVTFFGETHYDRIIDELYTREELDENSAPLFVSGTENYICIETNEGKLIAGAFKDAHWTLNRYKTRADARAAIQRYGEDAPWFIVLSD
ncbi:hypothetical protein FACS189490_10440 [Clostridia bacterium]|nr:hypothetical protein FACS189490_10440 [Clostridia bacterium]